MWGINFTNETCKKIDGINSFKYEGHDPWHTLYAKLSYLFKYTFSELHYILEVLTLVVQTKNSFP